MNSFSKTDIACSCGFLQNSANAPDTPIVYDARSNQFNLFCNHNGAEFNLLFWHCPICGGAAPESKHDLFFAVLSNEERLRLVELTQSLKTLDQVMQSLGVPNQDNEVGMLETFPETEGNPERTEMYRTLIYENLSDVANVHVTIYPNERASISFWGKYIGDKNVAVNESAG